MTTGLWTVKRLRLSREALYKINDDYYYYYKEGLLLSRRRGTMHISTDTNSTHLFYNLRNKHHMSKNQEEERKSRLPSYLTVRNLSEDRWGFRGLVHSTQSMKCQAEKTRKGNSQGIVHYNIQKSLHESDNPFHPSLDSAVGIYRQAITQTTTWEKS